MKVKIIKSSHWHEGMIGQIVNTTEPNRHGEVFVREPGATYHGNGLWKGDYEVVDDDHVPVPQPATKFVTVDGVMYEVPGWTTFVTRDKTGSSVWAWEVAPEWRELAVGRGEYGYYSKKGETCNHAVVKPYVEPKPDGNVFMEVA